MPVRRTFLGTSEQFFDAEKMMAKREMDAMKAKGMYKKKSTGFGNLLPNISGPRPSHGKASSSVQKESIDAYQQRKIDKKKNETDGFNKSQRMSETIKDSSAMKKDKQDKRNLSVGFGTG